MENIFSYKIPNSDKILDLKYNDNTFVPKATSDLLSKSTLKTIRKEKSVLDLGSGIGVVDIVLSLLGCCSKISASDLSLDAVNHI